MPTLTVLNPNQLCRKKSAADRLVSAASCRASGATLASVCLWPQCFPQRVPSHPAAPNPRAPSWLTPPRTLADARPPPSVASQPRASPAPRVDLDIPLHRSASHSSLHETSETECTSDWSEREQEELLGSPDIQNEVWHRKAQPGASPPSPQLWGIVRTATETGTAR